MTGIRNGQVSGILKKQAIEIIRDTQYDPEELFNRINIHSRFSQEYLLI